MSGRSRPRPTRPSRRASTSPTASPRSPPRPSRARPPVTTASPRTGSSCSTATRSTRTSGSSAAAPGTGTSTGRRWPSTWRRCSPAASSPSRGSRSERAPARAACGPRARAENGRRCRLEAGQPQAAEPSGPGQAARGGIHLRRRQLLRRADRLVHRRLDHVLEHLDVLGVHGAGVDRQLLQLQLAADLHGDHPAAGAGLHDLVLQLLLSLRHVGLHLLDLLHHLVHVRLTHQSFSSSAVSKTSSASNSARSRSISWSWSSVAGPGGGATESLSSNASVSGCPVIPRTAFATRSRPCSAFFLTNAASAGKATVRRSASSAVGVAADRAALSIPFSSATASATAGQSDTI